MELPDVLLFAERHRVPQPRSFHSAVEVVVRDLMRNVLEVAVKSAVILVVFFVIFMVGNAATGRMSATDAAVEYAKGVVFMILIAIGLPCVMVIAVLVIGLADLVSARVTRCKRSEVAPDTLAG